MTGSTDKTRLVANEIAAHLERNADTIVKAWETAINERLVAYRVLDRAEDPTLYERRSLRLVVYALRADTPEAHNSLMTDITSMADELAIQRVGENFQLDHLISSLAIFRAIILEDIRLLRAQEWGLGMEQILQVERLINEAVDLQIVATSRAYIATRDSIILARERSLRLANHQLMTMNRLSQAMGSSLEVSTVCNSFARGFLELTGFCFSAVALVNQAALDAQANSSVLMVAPDYGYCVLDGGMRLANRADLGAVRGLQPDGVALFEQIGAQVLQSKQPCIITDTQRDTLGASIAQHNLASFLCVPLRTADKYIGVVYGGDTEIRTLTPHELNLILTFANQAALSLVNARLFSECQIAYLEQKELDHVKDEFVSIASHELRTPLALIKGYAATLLRPGINLQSEKQQRFLHGIDDASNRLLRLLDNLLNVNRLDSGRFKVAPQTVNLRELIDQVVASFQGPGSGVGTPVVHQILVEAPAQVLVTANRDQLEQVLVNLVSNAIKYSPEGGKIRVSIRETLQTVQCCVSDEGIGVQPEYADHIFEKFYRVDTGLTRKTQGTGLGLYICKSIIEAYGGRIWLERKPENERGANFCFALPPGEWS